MCTFKKYETGEDFSMQIDIKDYISEDDLCKQVEKIVSELDISSLESNYSELGQNAFHPKMLLSIIFYGYTTGIRSGRKLSKACKENLPFIYLSKGYQPGKSVINDFRKDNYQHFSSWFNQVLKKCIASGLGDAELSIVDGSKLRANSSKRRTKTEEQYEKWEQRLLADIASLEKECSTTEQQMEVKEAEKKLAAKERLIAKVTDAIEQLSNNDSKTCLNLTDKDSLIMKGKKGNFDTNYNVQAACSEDQIITFCDVVLSGNDKAQLVPALKGIAQNTGKTIQKALADADYGTFDSFEYMDTNNIEGYVPYRDMNTCYETKPFDAANFKYDKAKDVYICPARQTLEFYRTSEDKKRKHQFRHYRTDACKQCPFKSQCCQKSTARRVIKRENRQDLRDQMKQRLNSPQGQKIYRKRLHPIESFFGHLKYNLGYTHFLLRGLEKVKAEFTLMCLAHNLRKLITILLRFFEHMPHNKGFHAAKKKKIVLPRFVNELLSYTLDFLLISLYIVTYLKVFETFILGQPVRLCAAF